MLRLIAKHKPILGDWLERRQQKLYTWTSHQIQESILKELGQATLRNILVDVKNATYYSIMVDETTDLSCEEQMAICIKYVDHDLIPREILLDL